MNDFNAQLCGIPISCTTFEHVLSDMEKAIRERADTQCISITNTESMYHALRIPEHLDYIHSSTFSLCDGIGVVIAGRFWGLKIPRLNGPVLMLKSCEYGKSRGWRHFFYGGKDGVADLMVEKLKQKFPDIIIVGTYAPPFRPLTSEEDEEVVAMISRSRPDIVWVGVLIRFMWSF